MSRERELLLLLVERSRKQGHAYPCPIHADYPDAKLVCVCGYDEVMKAAEYFTKNEAV